MFQRLLFLYAPVSQNHPALLIITYTRSHHDLALVLARSMLTFSRLTFRDKHLETGNTTSDPL
jgi:hypothetical protein